MPPVPAAGVPLSTPVDASKVTPLGSVPVSLSVGDGIPESVIVNVLAEPWIKVVLTALVKAGASSTVNV